MHDNINLVTSETKLLFDIRELLIEQNCLLKSILSHEGKQDDIIPETENSVFTCKICGEKHDNKGSLMACYRKHKKEGEST